MISELTSTCIRCGCACSRLTSKGRVRKVCEPCSHRPGTHRGPKTVKRDCPMRRYGQNVKEFEVSFPMPPATSKLRCVQCLGLIPSGCKSVRVCSGRCGKMAYKRGRIGGRCIRCGDVTPPYHSKYCGEACRTAEKATKAPLPKVPCHSCGELFKRRNKSHTCRSCADSNRGAAESRRRKRQRDGDKSIHWRPLGERDGWKCHICGLKVLQKAGTAHEPNGATVDHLVPVAKDGEHVWANVALAHRHCNSSRQTGGVAQLRLVG